MTVSLRPTRQRRPAVIALLALLAPLAVVLAGPTAAVEVDDGTVVVRSGALSAVVDRSPFALRLLDEQGRDVLATTANKRPDPMVRLPLPERVPGGLPTPQAPALYAPITFTVGEQALAQFPAGFWQGNVLLGASVGVEHALTDVTEVRELEDGVELDVATTDPSGRTALVSMLRGPGRTFEISVRFSDSTALAVTTASFTTGPDEAFHGFGGRRNATDQRGEAFYNWLEEFAQRPDAFEPLTALPVVPLTYQFPTGPQGSYYPQSLFVSSRPYALLLDRDEVSHWRMASDRDDAWQVAVAADGLDLVVALGDAPQAIGDITALNGRNPQVPAWVRGAMISRAVELFDTNPATYAAKVQADLEAVAAERLPITAMMIEGWPLLEQIGVLDDVVARMRSLGIRPLFYYKAFVGGGDGYERPEVLQEAIDLGLVATTVTGQPFLFGSPLGNGGVAAMLDFTNPATVSWWKARVKEGLDLGAEGFMQDFGEQVMVDMRFADGSTGAQMHNRLPKLYHRVTREALAEYAADHPGREPWFFVRAGYSGREGTAAVVPTNWGGDNTADWNRASGLASVVPDMLNRAVGGAYAYTTDIGGYIDTFGRADVELLTRWAQLASLIPVNRLHGSPINGTPTPWELGPEAVELYRATLARRIEAEPLIRELWRQAEQTGIPITRPLWLHHPDDPQARAQDQQWLLGPDVLVAPVVEPGARSRSVYLPEGCWQHADTGEQADGPQALEVAAALDSLPLFLRCGVDGFAAALERVQAGTAGTPLVAAPLTTPPAEETAAAGTPPAAPTVAVGAVGAVTRGTAAPARPAARSSRALPATGASTTLPAALLVGLALAVAVALRRRADRRPVL